MRNQLALRNLVVPEKQSGAMTVRLLFKITPAIINERNLNKRNNKKIKYLNILILIILMNKDHHFLCLSPHFIYQR